jgi:lipocalin
MFHKPRHVIVIDNDHTLALVCGPNQQDFSIISKSTDPDAARLERIMTQAQAAGFPVREAFWVPTK